MGQKLAAARIPDEWVQQIEAIAASRGTNASSIVREAIGQYLGMVDNNPLTPLITGNTDFEAIKDRLTALEDNNLLTAVNAVTTSLKAINDRLTVLEDNNVLAAVNTKDIARQSPIVGDIQRAKPKPRVIKGKAAMTTGELYAELQANGYQKSQATLRRALASSLEAGKLAPDLIELGISTDFEARRSANPKDNSVRWLFLD